ncbi:uncharacterized protein [Montipora capricornis]|uniref:uncharacterized protein n=1 Tax=Montipora capricornis TaxID=246305 RepID=UPI0035F21499
MINTLEFFSTLDFVSAYHAFEIHNDDREKTAFSTKQGHWQWKRVPFGPNAAPFFVRQIASLLAGMAWEELLAFFDDVLIFGATFAKHCESLDRALSLIEKAGLKVKPEKCCLLPQRVPFVGHILSAEGVSTDPKKVSAVKSWPPPTNVSELRVFLGKIGYYRRLIPDVATVASPLFVLEEKGRNFVWSNDCQRSFDALRQALFEAPVLAYPRFDLPFILDTDASMTGVAAVLSQELQDLCGHLSVRKTKDNVRKHFYWIGYTADIELYCRTCHTCGSRNEPIPRVRAPMQPLKTGYPLERIQIDILGPLPETNKGNKYVAVVVDMYTKWPEAYALPDQEANTVARTVMDNFVCRFGCPRGILSDQDRNFESRTFRGLCSLIESVKQRTTPYHPQCDRGVERLIRTVTGVIAKVAEEQEEWDQYLPKVLLGLRASTHETTGFFPSMLMFGRELRLPIDAMREGLPSEQSPDYPSFVDREPNLNQRPPCPCLDRRVLKTFVLGGNSLHDCSIV